VPESADGMDFDADGGNTSSSNSFDSDDVDCVDSDGTSSEDSKCESSDSESSSAPENNIQSASSVSNSLPGVGGRMAEKCHALWAMAIRHRFTTEAMKDVLELAPLLCDTESTVVPSYKDMNSITNNIPVKIYYDICSKKGCSYLFPEDVNIYTCSKCGSLRYVGDESTAQIPSPIVM
jgi:hypothetical protein